MEAIKPYIPFLIPILIIQLGLMSFALVDLARRPTPNRNFWGWVIIIVLFNIIGPIIYFLIGRREE